MHRIQRYRYHVYIAVFVGLPMFLHLAVNTGGALLHAQEATSKPVEQNVQAEQLEPTEPNQPSPPSPGSTSDTSDTLSPRTTPAGESLALPGSIITSQEFMENVAARYGEMNDFQALMRIATGGQSELAELYVKPPTKLHIAYRVPQGQIINSDGEDFYIYLPEENVVLHQERRGTFGSAGTFVTRSGLDLLLKNYTVSYFDKPDFAALEDIENDDRITIGNSRTQPLVVKIRLRRKIATQSFREIVLSIGKDNLIYRVEALTFDRERVQFDFINMLVNEGIPDSKFKFEVPATAPVIDDLFYKDVE